MARKQQATADTAAPAENNAPETGADELAYNAATMSIRWAKNAAGEFAQNYFGGSETTDVEVRRYADKTFTAFIATSDNVFTSDKADGGRYKSAGAAIKNAVANIPGIETKAIGDTEGDAPDAPGDNTPVIDPWDEDAEDKETADRLRAIGEDVAAKVDDLKVMEGRTRDTWLGVSRELAEAYGYVASLSETSRGGNKASTAAWGRYIERYFPAIKSMGKNVPNEAVTLGNAPERVIEVWPARYTSPKSFQSWLNSVRSNLVDETFHALVVASGLRDQLVDWVENGKTSTIPTRPDKIRIREFLINELPDILDRKSAEAEKDKQKVFGDSKSTIDQKAAATTRADDFIAMRRVARWFADTAPEISEGDANCQFAKSAFCRAVVKRIESEWNEYTDMKTPEAKAAEAESEVTEATKKVSEAFADKEIGEAADHLFRILVAHPEAEDVLETLRQRMDQRDTEAETAADAGEEDADAALDGAAE